MKNAFHNAMLLFGALLVTLILTEIVLRTFNLAPTTGVATVNEFEFNTIPGIFAPNQKLVDTRKPKLSHDVAINSLGYRGVNFSLKKPSGEKRVLIVGDSLTYGDFVDNDQTLPSFLEAKLNEKCDGIRVINAGLGGSSITEHINIVERSMAISPDVVVLVFYENDIVGLVGKPMWEQLEQNRRVKSQFPIAIIYPIVQQMALWNFALKVYGKLYNSSNAKEMKQPDERQRKLVLKKNRYKYIELLTKLRKMVNSKGLPFAFAIFPSHHTFSATDRISLEPIKWISNTAKKLGVQFVEFLPALKESEKNVNELYLLPEDGHPTPLGYKLVSGALADYMLSKKMFDTSCL
jgi:lysophospholipase L1-like esterase